MVWSAAVNADTTKAMHPDTIAALQALAEALAANPDDRTELTAYGNLPAHLSDAIDDYSSEYNPLE